MRARPPAPPDLIWFDWLRPTVDCCICIRCGLVVRPVGDHLYRCCGEIWVLQGRYAKPLPDGFWQLYDYGSIVPKRLRQDVEPPNNEPEHDDEEAA